MLMTYRPVDNKGGLVDWYTRTMSLGGATHGHFGRVDGLGPASRLEVRPDSGRGYSTMATCGK
jgi:hypothetical protein